MPTHSLFCIAYITPQAIFVMPFIGELVEDGQAWHKRAKCTAFWAAAGPAPPLAPPVATFRGFHIGPAYALRSL